ncbi:hypothetical protein C7S16_7209 [Burkholderia thailandensis]|uniref:Uncharacterized protein n=1 Tax=Burkholderia thailandensis TaxID=57975 RepID=A0AAW9CT63_BURTH|nr:hypothetical protein [Burkholderia thailandensis]MDW9252796.1 hypothetical protein [Burkholderia thailandensis]
MTRRRATSAACDRPIRRAAAAAPEAIRLGALPHESARPRRLTPEPTLTSLAARPSIPTPR